MEACGAGKMKVDVVLLTKNSLKPCLGDCVHSIYKNVPLNRLIVVDGGSTDGTIEYLKKFPNVVIIDDSKGCRATARQIGIDMVETDWFLFVDSDVILSRNWFNEAWKKLRMMWEQFKELRDVSGIKLCQISRKL